MLRESEKKNYNRTIGGYILFLSFPGCMLLSTTLEAVTREQVEPDASHFARIPSIRTSTKTMVQVLLILPPVQSIKPNPTGKTWRGGPYILPY